MLPLYFCFAYLVCYPNLVARFQSCNVRGSAAPPEKSVLHNSNPGVFLQSLIDTCIESAGEFLKSNFGKDVIYEVFLLCISFVF